MLSFRSGFRQNPSCSLLPKALVSQQLEGWCSRECGWERCSQQLRDWALAQAEGFWLLLSPGAGGNLPGDGWWKTKSCHGVNGMWLTLNSVTEFLWFSVTATSIGYWDWVLNKMSGRLKIRFRLKRCRESAEHMKLSLILFLPSAKEVLTGSSFKLAKVTIFGKSKIRVEKWQT